MNNKRSLRLLLVFVVSSLTIALSACSGDKAGDSSSQITIGISQDLDSLDPQKAVAAGTKEILFNVFEGLMKPDSEGNLIPAVASDYTISEDQLTYTFTLREGVTFHNGENVTVADIKYSIEQCAGMDGLEPLVAAFSVIEEVEIVDEEHIRIVLSAPDSDLLANLASVTAAIVPMEQEDRESNPVGTGPYRYVSRSVQENVLLEAYEGYWGTPAKIQNITLKICANADTIVMELLGGTIDMYPRLTATQAAQLGQDFDILEGTMNLVQALYINHAVEPFDNQRVREALSYAMNVEELLSLTADGRGTRIGSSMFPAFEKYFKEELVTYYEQDIQKAKDLLTEAGYPDGFAFTITVPSNYQPHVDTAQVLVEQFKAIGVTATIELVDWDTWLSRVYLGREYETTVIGVDAATLSPRALLERFTTESSGNFINYSNLEYDEAFAKAVETTDEAMQKEYYQECQTILTETAANVYIQDMAELVALNKRYGGYEFYPLYVQDFSKLYIVEE